MVDVTVIAVDLAIQPQNVFYGSNFGYCFHVAGNI